MKVKFEDSHTMVNLAKAFAGECQEGARYQFIAQKCEQEGYPYIKTLLKTIAKNEMSHAKVLYDTIVNHCPNTKINNIDISGGYPFRHGTLVENLKSCYENEESEKNVIYPNFAKIACDEGYPEIEKIFLQIADVENCHYLLVKQLYNLLKDDKLYKKSTPIKWKCGECGHEETAKTAWQICPLCSSPQGYTQIPIDVNK